MPDQKLSQLTSATTVAGSDQLYIVQGGQSKRATASQLPISTATAAALDGKEVTGTAATAITAHLAAVDPHPTYLTQAEAGALYAAASHNQSASTITGLASVATSGTYTDLSGRPTLGTAAALNAGTAAGNVPILDSSALIPSALLPGFVDDVLEFASLAAFPVTGEAGKLYINLATNRQYRWSGSTYAEINPSPGSTDAVPEGSVNLYHTSARGQSAASSWWSGYRSTVGDQLATAASQATARSVIGITIGTAAGNVIALDGAGKLPAVDGSQLTNLPGGPGGGSPGGTGSELQFRSSSSAFGAVTGSSVDGSGNITLGAKLGLSVNNALSSSALLLSGTWITSGGTGTTTKPAVLIEPAGTTSSGWPTAGSAFAINCPSGFAGWPFLVHQNASLRFGIDLANNRTHINNTGGRGDIYFDKQGSGGDPRIVGLNSTSTFTFTGMNVVSVPHVTATSTSAPLFTSNNESALTAYTLVMRRQGGAGVTDQVIEGGSRGGQDESNAGLTLRALARGTAPSTTPTNATGSPLNLFGGDAFTNATNTANGGVVTINGGIGYGTGVAGNVVVCNLRGFFQFGREITVAQLPAASATLRRAEAVVSDASSPTIGSAVVGGGSAIAKVFCNGSQWTVIAN